MRAFSETVVEQGALVWPEAIGWRIAHGPDVAPGEPGAERDEYGQVVLKSSRGGRLRGLGKRTHFALMDDLQPREERT
jgi:type I restriction enzyme R subunit